MTDENEKQIREDLHDLVTRYGLPYESGGMNWQDIVEQLIMKIRSAEKRGIEIGRRENDCFNCKKWEIRVSERIAEAEQRGFEKGCKDWHIIEQCRNFKGWNPKQFKYNWEDCQNMDCKLRKTCVTKLKQGDGK